MSPHGLAAISALAEITDSLQDATFLVCRFDSIIDRYFLDKCKQLKVVLTLTTGTSHIDSVYCNENGIRIYTLHDDSSALQKITSSSEYALTLVLMAARGIGQSIRSPQGDTSTSFRYHKGTKEISSSRFGIIGFGRIGQYVSSVLSQISREVIFYDPYVLTSSLKGAKKCSWHDIVDSDVVLVSCTYNASTHDMLNHDSFFRYTCENSFSLVNIARGPIVNCSSVIHRVRAGNASYYVDVYDSYPVNERNQLLSESLANPNIILTPHMGGKAATAVLKADMIGCSIIKSLLSQQ